MISWDEYALGRSPSRNRLTFPEHRHTVVKFIDYFKELDVEMSILDVGCGDGFWLEVLRDLGFGNIYGVDLSMPLLLRAKSKGLKVAQCDALRLVLRKTFDVIIMCDVLEHLTDPEVALRNVYDCLNENGRFYLSIPVYESLSSRYMRLVKGKSRLQEAQEHDETHVHAFSRPSIESLLKRVGFKIEKLFYTANRIPLVSGKVQKFTFWNRFGNWLNIVSKKHGSNY